VALDTVRFHGMTKLTNAEVANNRSAPVCVDQFASVAGVTVEALRPQAAAAAQAATGFGVMSSPVPQDDRHGQGGMQLGQSVAIES
jgi:hypothetical protein